MFSRVAVAVLLLLFRCGISDPGGSPPSDTITDVDSGLPHDDSSGHDGLPDPPTDIITGVDSGNPPSHNTNGQDGLPDPPTDIITGVDSDDPPSDNTNGQDGSLDPPTDNTGVDSGQPHDGDTNGDADLPEPPTPVDPPGNPDPPPSDGNGQGLPPGSFDRNPPPPDTPTVPAGNPPDDTPNETPSADTPIESVPPLDFDMNAIAQISSFPFARADVSADPFHKFITAQYSVVDQERMERQKCYRGDPTADPPLHLDTRMPTPLLKLEETNASKLVREYDNCTAGLRQEMIVVEPAFPSRLYCEACLAYGNPTEFYHLQGYNRPTSPKIGDLKPVTLDQFYTADKSLPADSTLPLAAWADPQYSYKKRIAAWKELTNTETAADEDNKLHAFDSEHPIRPLSIDRFLTTGVSPMGNERLTNFSADGIVRILSSPLPTSNARPRHLTLACAQVQSSVAFATDTIKHIEFIGMANELLDEKIPENVPLGYKFSEWEVYDRSRFEVKEALITSMNLVVYVHFSPYSCCSACCCTREQCGLKHATSEEACADLNSTSTRTGHLVVRTFDKKKSVAIDGVDAEGLKEFNALLSQEPFATVGLPIYSQRFRHVKWAKIQEKLLDPTKGFGNFAAKDGKATPRFVETIKCDNKHKQCTAWAKCRGFEIPEIPINPEDDPIILNAKCKTAEIPGLKVINLEEDFNTVQLQNGDSVRVIAATLNASQVHWSIGKKVIAFMNVSKSCDEQDNIFVDLNKRDLIIRNLEVDSTIEESTFTASSATTAARVNVVVERKSYLKENMMWIIAVGAAFAVIFVALLVFCAWWRCCRKRGGKSSRTSKRTKASMKNSKEGDEGNSGSDKKKDKEGTTKEVTPAVDDFFATPIEREKAETNVPVPVPVGEKDPFIIVTDQERTTVVKEVDDGPKVSIPAAPGEPSSSPAAAATSPALPGAAAAAEKDDEKESSSKSSSKSDRKDEKGPKNKDDKKNKKKDAKKDSKKKDGKKDKKKSDKKDAGKKKTTKKSPKKDSPIKKTSPTPKKPVKKSAAGKKK